MNEHFYIKKYAVWHGNIDNNGPNVNFIQPIIRRRLTNVEKIGLYLAKQTEPYGQDIKVVFASQYGEWQQTIKLIEQVYNDNEMSPAGFSHSVHNAMPGMLAIINNIPYNYTTVAANEQTIDCALVEALSTEGDVLFIYAEEQTPEFYKDNFDEPFYGHGIAFIISHSSLPEARKINVLKTSYQFETTTNFAELVKFVEGKKELQTRFCKLKEAS